MKNLKRALSLTLALLLVISSTSTFAASTKEKAVAKAKEVVENGSPDDWLLLAKQADYLIRKDAGMSTAKQWLDTSLGIQENEYNLEIMGDYYLSSNLASKAISYYILSMNKYKEGDPAKDTSYYQDKIWKAKSQR